MGSSYTFLKAEKNTWLEHNLQYDSSVRETCLKMLHVLKDGEEIRQSYTKSTWGGIEYQHWFVTNGTIYIEFGSASLDIYTARVNINTTARTNHYFDPRMKAVMDDKIRQRIKHVLGMKNYSLCLRNCEHVANYIIRGRWISMQMDEQGQGLLLNIFKNEIMGDHRKLINTFPSSIKPHIFENKENKLYTFIENKFIANGFDYYLDSEEDTFNILVIGPTGAGKSHLINVLFNNRICDSDVSHASVTREIYFVRGVGEIFDVNESKLVTKNIVVADTVGLCDTDWDDEQIINLIKGRVSSNFKYIDVVYIVFRADRLLKNHVESIKKVLQWLNYKKSPTRIQFVGTYADHLDDAKKNQLRREAINILQLGETAILVTNINTSKLLP